VGLIKKLVQNLAFHSLKSPSLFARIASPSGREYADFLRYRKILHAIGPDCQINSDVVITDPRYVSLGSNVILSSCRILGHDASVAVFASVTGKVLDSVGPVIIGDNVFVGYGAIVLPNIRIGNNSIVAAGAVVTRDVASGTIVAGVPARPVGTTTDFLEKTEARTRELPWYPLISARKSGFDPRMEPLLVKMREAHFFPTDED
jgi:acetyltransferase-like isoleucine patch superfamily enzyme